MSNLVRVAPELPSSDIARSLEYYTNQLGFQVAMIMPGGDYAVVERDSVAIHLFEAAPGHEPAAIHVFIEGIDELHGELAGRGANVVQGVERKPWGNREFRVSDASGNVIKFTETLSND